MCNPLVKKIWSNSFVLQWFLPGSFFSFTSSEIQGFGISWNIPFFATVAPDKKWLWQKFGCSPVCHENQTQLSSHPLSIFVNTSMIWRFYSEEVVSYIFKIIEEQPPIQFLKKKSVKPEGWAWADQKVDSFPFPLSSRESSLDSEEVSHFTSWFFFMGGLFSFSVSQTFSCRWERGKEPRRGNTFSGSCRTTMAYDDSKNKEGMTAS